MTPFDELLAPLPEAVVRYLRYALPQGAAAYHAAHLLQQGEMRLKEGGGKWLPFRAEQRIALSPPEFQWQARIRLAPLLWASVIDEYRDGLGRLDARLWGVVPLAHAENDRRLDEGELLRYLAEAVWFPPALLPSSHLQWHATGPHSALALLRDGPVQARLTFHVNERGEITRAEALRPALQGKQYITRSWSAHYSDWQEHHGMRLPMAGSVSWGLESGPWEYWRGKISAVSFT